MGYISAVFARRFADHATDRHPARASLRRELGRRVGIDVDAPVDPKQMIGADAFFSLLEYIAQDIDGGRSVAVRVGASMRCDDYGAFGLAFKSAVDLRGSFQRVERYGKVVTSVANFTVEESPGAWFIAVRPETSTRLGLQMTNELAVAAATALSREVCVEDFAPIAVQFAHEAPSVLSAHAAHFRCPVQFGAERDGMTVAVAELDAGNKLGDARISEFFDIHLDQELAQIAFAEGLAKQVMIQITQTLSEGAPSIADIADRMGVSSRTLQRRLAAEGYVFQDLVTRARRDLAEQLLRRSDYALAEIAFLTGYSEQSTFARAFKRWSGETPAHYRKAAAKA